MDADLDTLATALYARIDDLLKAEPVACAHRYILPTIRPEGDT